MKLISSNLLRAFLEERQMTHRQLARYAGCSHAFVAHLTAGRRTTCTPKLAENIAEALSCPLDVLFAPQVPRSSATSAAGDAA